MDTILSICYMIWILMSSLAIGKSEKDCVSENLGRLACCYIFPDPPGETVKIRCLEASSSIAIVKVVHIFGGYRCTDGDIQHSCNISKNNIVWRSDSNTYLSDESCLTNSNECRFGIEPIQSIQCYGDQRSGAVVITFDCHISQDTTVDVTTNLIDFSTRIDLIKTSQAIEISTYNVSPTQGNDIATLTLATENDNLTYTYMPTVQERSIAGTIGGSVVGAVVVICVVIVIIIFIKRKRQRDAAEKTKRDDTNTNPDAHVYYQDIESSVTNQFVQTSSGSTPKPDEHVYYQDVKQRTTNQIDQTSEEMHQQSNEANEYYNVNIKGNNTDSSHDTYHHLVHTHIATDNLEIIQYDKLKL